MIVEQPDLAATFARCRRTDARIYEGETAGDRCGDEGQPGTITSRIAALPRRRAHPLLGTYRGQRSHHASAQLRRLAVSQMLAMLSRSIRPAIGQDAAASTTYSRK